MHGVQFSCSVTHRPELPLDHRHQDILRGATERLSFAVPDDMPCRICSKQGRLWLAYVVIALYFHAYCFLLVEQSVGLLAQQSTTPVCRGLGRRAVDWWVVLKHPAGYQYSYIDSSISGCSGGDCWRHRLTMLNPNPVGHTLAVLATESSRRTSASSIAYALYNDADPPGVEHFDFAHAKGVVAFRSSSDASDSYQGFWLVHSAPRFPNDPAQPRFDDLAAPQSVFGQHFVCFTLAGKQSITAVAAMLLAAGPYIYNSSLPVYLAAELPTWQQLLNGSSDTVPMSVSIHLQTAAGVQLQGFAKTKYLNVSLTDVVVAPGIFSTMLWETWRRSHDAVPSFCPVGHEAPNTNQYSSLNIQRVTFPNTPYTWSSLSDHSKWGISSSTYQADCSRIADVHNSEQQYVVCLGDMNRAWWQSRRGGGYVCVRHSGLWQAFNSIVAGVEPCTAPVMH